MQSLNIYKLVFGDSLTWWFNCDYTRFYPETLEMLLAVLCIDAVY